MAIHLDDPGLLNPDHERKPPEPPLCRLLQWHRAFVGKRLRDRKNVTKVKVR